MYHCAELTSSSGDKPLSDALQLMNDEGLTSIPVVDNAFNVVGNISTADVKLLTNSASLPLLKASCIHFVSVILSERGVNDGKDSFPGKSTSFFMPICPYTDLSSFPRQPLFHPRPYNRQTSSDKVPQNVDCRVILSFAIPRSYSFGNTLSQLRKPTFPYLTCPCISITWSIPRCFGSFYARRQNFWPADRCCFVDGYPQPLWSPIWFEPIEPK
jgi:hypothetical protein